jgi:hypothetical protein
MIRPGVVALIFALLAPAPAAAQYPLFDAHIHYSRPDWDTYTPERILSILAKAGIRRALVGSTPVEGTLKLYDKAPAVIVPALRPYRTREDMSTWPRDAAIAAYVEERLKRGIYRAIGEAHYAVSDVTAPTVKRLAEVAAQQKLFFWSHIDDATVEGMLKTYPGTRMLWAHAGMSAGAQRVGELVDRYPMLWVELALRSDVAPGGTLDSEWQKLFTRHPDRFLIGTDTWVTSRWESVVSASEAVQVWLRQLPRDVAEQIAWKNGDRLFPPP